MTDNDYIDFIISKLRSDVQVLELGVWNKQNEINAVKNRMKDQVKDLEDITKSSLKEIAVLEHTITVLQGLKK